MVREEIDEYRIGDAYVIVERDTEGAVGKTHTVTVANAALDPAGEWSVVRSYYFDTYSDQSARDFARNVVNDDAYRRDCLERRTPWAQINDTYTNAAREIRSYFENAGIERNDGGIEGDDGESAPAREVCHDLCQRLYDGLKSRIGAPDRRSEDQPEVESFIQARKDEARQWLGSNGFLIEEP